mmetsp:Transcript_20193/g.44026  ORF Transcript_20193/g.44026 Transcript_20193/m.44026 type:complete len:395 (-) Transcript_20193:381-1565(-)
MADVQTQVSGLTNARNTSPGTAYGRINYVLHENVVRANVLDKVKEARQATVESKPDLLGVRGTPWNGSVQPITDNAKYSIKASDWKLTNTLTAEHLNPKDLRTVRGSLHVPNRPSTTLRTEGSGNWNASTTLDPAELKRQAQAMTKLSLANTTQRSGTLSPAKYLTPVQQQTAITEAVRQAKANNGVNYDELVATYGREGADHMVQILTMRATQRQVPPLPGSTTQRPKPRSKTQPADIAAVQALKFADEDSEDERERAAAQQQQQQQEGEEELLEGAGAGDEQAAASAASESAPEPQQAPAPSAPLQASASQKSSSGASAAAAAAAPPYSCSAAAILLADIPWGLLLLPLSEVLRRIGEGGCLLGPAPADLLVPAAEWRACLASSCRSSSLIC